MTTESPSGRKHPNILLIIVDQMRYHAMAPSGNEQVITPNLSRLATEGALMEEAVSNSPVCTPARACLLTGMHPLTHTTLTNNSVLPTHLPSMGKHLEARGYDTGYIGKWHLAGEAYVGATESNRGQDGYIPPGDMRHGWGYWAVHHCAHNYWNASYFRDTPERIRIEGWEPDAQTDLALEFLRERALGDAGERAPFALVVSWGTPHTPFIAPDAFKALYDPAKLVPRRNVACTRTLVEHSDHHPCPYPDPGKTLRDNTWNYYAAVSNIDHNLGRLLDSLSELGLADDTIVVFTSDHGDMLGSHGHLHKTQPREESIRVPMLIRYPGVIRGARRFAAPFGLVDTLPTLLDLAGLDPIAGGEGIDFAPLLRGEPFQAPTSSWIAWPCSATTWGKRWRPCLVDGRGYEPGFMRCYRAVRTRTHTYVRHTDGPWMLYDNEHDPFQLDNLVESQGPGAVPPELEREMRDWLERTGDFFGTTQDYTDMIDVETGALKPGCETRRRVGG